MRRHIARLVLVSFILHLIPLQAESPTVFKSVGLMVPDGDKAKEEDALLTFDGDRLTIHTKSTPDKVWPYASIRSGDYSYSKSPRWKSGAGVALAVGVFAIPIFFMKGKKHWLTVKTTDDFAVLHLDKNNYKLIIAALETRAHIDVETLGEEK